MFQSFYRGYLALLHAGGSETRGHHRYTAAKGGARTFEEIDGAATRYGEMYRGAGVAVALLGASVVFFALWPIALPNLAGKWTERAEMSLLALASVLWAMVVLLGWKGRWIRLRLAAEALRYAHLRQSLESARARKPGALDDLKSQVHEILLGSDGAAGQIQYNIRKVEQYERIESCTKRLTYVAFVVSLTAASANLYSHREWLVYLTIFLPVFVATLHGINSFLRLPQLISQHEEMASVLQQMEKRIKSGLNEDEWLALCGELLSRLEAGDRAWTGIASRQDLNPV